MGDLEQAVILEAQSQETNEEVTELQAELLNWKDWTEAIEAIQEDDDIQKCVQFYYASADTDLRTDGMESPPNDSDKMKESTEDFLSEHSNTSETSEGDSDKMDQTTEDTLSEYGNTSDTSETYATPVSSPFSLDFSKLMKTNSETIEITLSDYSQEFRSTSGRQL